jgi:hypothetical protein
LRSIIFDVSTTRTICRRGKYKDNPTDFGEKTAHFLLENAAVLWNGWDKYIGGFKHGAMSLFA